MMGESVQQIADEIVKLLTTYGLDVVGAVVILIVGRIAAPPATTGRSSTT